MEYRKFGAINSGTADYEMGGSAISTNISSVLAKVFNWMALGLLITALVSFFVASQPQLVASVFNSGMFWVLFIIEIGMVWFLSARVTKLNASTALMIFLAYAGLNGITLSIIYLIYTAGSIALTFMVAAGMFGGMALWGYTTKKDLSGMGSIMGMALWGLILASLANLFMHSPALYWLTAYAGVVIFCGLTAWDIQKIKRYSTQFGGMENRLAVYGALILYLDFINLFLHLLRIMGRRR